ncbi:MAG: hypothetical protein O3A36_04170 [bacterium]|nr:hypothetical protein [bacterium]
MRLKSGLKVVLAITLFVTVAGEGYFLIADYLAKRLPQAPKECFDLEKEYDKWICFRPYFNELVRKVSPAYAMTEAKVLKEKKVLDDCHLNAHFIGEAALEKYDFDPGKAFAAGEFGCIEGYFHGVMERYVRYKADPYSVTSKVKNICDTVSSPNPQKEALLKSQCAHGIGHGLVAHNFLPIADALAACEDMDYAWRCKGGVEMEHVEQYLSLEEHELKGVLPEICKPFADLDDPASLSGCASNIGVALMWYTKHDLAQSKKLCEELGESEQVHICKSGTEAEELINLKG